MLTFQKPRIECITADDTYGKFVVEPLERGYGFTLGNSLRRVLLSSLTGTAATHIKIDGILHEFSTIKGVKEDTTELILNIKKMKLKLLAKESKVIRLEAKGEMVVRAMDFVSDPEVEILNPDHVIAHLTDKNSKLVLEVSVDKGRSYIPSEKHEIKEGIIGLIPIDSNFSPIEKVRYNVEDTRIGQVINYDKLIIEVWADGSIKPMDAIIESSKLLREYYDCFIDIKEERKVEEVEEKEEPSVKDVTVEELGLSIRSLNCLKRAGLKTLGEIMEYSEEDLMRLKNFGAKSLDEIKATLEQHNLRLKEITLE